MNELKQYSQEELNEILENHKLWLIDNNKGKRANLSGSDLSDSDFSHSNLSDSDLSHSNLSGSDLSGSDLDFSCLFFSCSSLKAKFDKKHIIQMLYHAAMPTQHNNLELDADIIELFNSDLFKKVVNKFHRVEECGLFVGVSK
jgi:hypothetical protein